MFNRQSAEAFTSRNFHNSLSCKFNNCNHINPWTTVGGGGGDMSQTYSYFLKRCMISVNSCLLLSWLMSSDRAAGRPLPCLARRKKEKKIQGHESALLSGLGIFTHTSVFSGRYPLSNRRVTWALKGPICCGKFTLPTFSNYNLSPVRQ